MNRIKIFYVFFIFIFINCDQPSEPSTSTDTQQSPQGPKSYVYVAGYYKDGSMSMENQACFWVNGKRTDIGNNSIANGLIVVDDKVYVAITQTYNDDTAHCWANGEKIDLNLPGNLKGNYPNESRANAITVVDDVIYVAGAHNYVKGLSSFPFRACYWRIRQDNNSWEIIDLPGEVPEAKAIVVEDGKVYVAGNYCYWVDDERIDLPGTGDVYTTSMTVKNGKVYIVGYTAWNGKSPCYWVDGEVVELVNVVNVFNETIMTSIAIKEDKVYITCSDCFGDSPYYLIDGEKKELSRNTYSTADAIAVEDNKVYVAGCTNGTGANYAFSKACYWVDGKQTVLETGRNSYVGITSIAVVIK